MAATTGFSMSFSVSDQAIMADAYGRVFIGAYLEYGWDGFPVDYRLRMRYRYGLMKLAGPKGRLP